MCEPVSCLSITSRDGESVLYSNVRNTTSSWYQYLYNTHPGRANTTHINQSGQCGFAKSTVYWNTKYGIEATPQPQSSHNTTGTFDSPLAPHALLLQAKRHRCTAPLQRTQSVSRCQIQNTSKRLGNTVMAMDSNIHTASSTVNDGSIRRATGLT